MFPGRKWIASYPSCWGICHSRPMPLGPDIVNSTLLSCFFLQCLYGYLCYFVFYLSLRLSLYSLIKYICRYFTAITLIYKSNCQNLYICNIKSLYMLTIDSPTHLGIMRFISIISFIFLNIYCRYFKFMPR